MTLNDYVKQNRNNKQTPVEQFDWCIKKVKLTYMAFGMQMHDEKHC